MRIDLDCIVTPDHDKRDYKQQQVRNAPDRNRRHSDKQAAVFQRQCQKADENTQAQPTSLLAHTPLFSLRLDPLIQRV